MMPIGRGVYRKSAIQLHWGYWWRKISARLNPIKNSSHPNVYIGASSQRMLLMYHPVVLLKFIVLIATNKHWSTVGDNVTLQTGNGLSDIHRCKTHGHLNLERKTMLSYWNWMKIFDRDETALTIWRLCFRFVLFVLMALFVRFSIFFSIVLMVYRIMYFFVR